MLELLMAANIETSKVCIPDHPCIIYAAECERGSRDCFPDDLVGTGFIGDIRYVVP
jgi:hypothetical protein